MRPARLPFGGGPLATKSSTSVALLLALPGQASRVSSGGALRRRRAGRAIAETGAV